MNLVEMQERARRLRDKVKKTWNPPRITGSETSCQIAQTVTMLILAFVFGKEFLGDLSEVQDAVIDEGLEVLEEVL